MTAKDYKIIGTVIKSINFFKTTDRENLISAFCLALSIDNPRFKPAKFTALCRGGEKRQTQET